jgi:Ca-activated chloride channel family protein
MGNGEPMIITKQNEADKQAEQFRNYINTPALTRIRVDYGTFQAMEVEPSSIPDMLAERPIIIFGKYEGSPAGIITLTGKAGKKNYKQSFQLSNVKPDTNYAAIRYLWAREQIKLLGYMEKTNNYSYHRTNKQESYAKKITELGLKYNLMTNYTSFIAIDEQLVMKDGKLITVKQPIPLPEGVSDYAVGYEAAQMSPIMLKVNTPVMGIDVKDYESSSEEIEIEDTDVEEEEEVEEEVFVVVEKLPEFPGGDAARIKFIADNVVYPDVEMQKDKLYRVIVSFIIEVDGRVSNIKIVKSCGIKECDEEALRVIRLMPKWKPGRQRGKPVRCMFQCPITFTVVGE